MTYVLKVSDYNLFVEKYYVSSQDKDRHLHIVYTDKPEMALTFNDIEDASLHLMFIWANSTSSDTTVSALCIAEAQTYYKEL